MWLSGGLSDRLGIRICFDSVGGVGAGAGAGSASGASTGGEAAGTSGTGEAAGGSDVGGSDAAGQSCSAAESFGDALGAAADAPSQDDEAETGAAACTLGDEGLRDYSASATAATSLAADVRAVEAAASVTPSQEFSPGDIDPVTNNTVADVTAQGRITSQIDENGRALTGAALADVQRAAVAAAVGPEAAPAQADLSLAGFPDPSGLHTGFVTGLDLAGQPLVGVVPVSQPDPVAPARSWADDFRGYLSNSLEALGRVPGDLRTLAQDFLDRPLDTTTSLANSFPQTRVGAATATGAVAALGGIRAAIGVAPFQVGRFDRLSALSRVGDDLALHHAGQKHAMQQIISGYNLRTAPAIALPTAQHRAIPNLTGPYVGSARDLLARDIRNLRNYTDAPNRALQELIELNRQAYPGAFAR